MKVEKRNKELEEFDVYKIIKSVQKAFKSCKKSLPKELKEALLNENFENLANEKGILKIEKIQDFIRNLLMQVDKDVANSFVIYRNERKKIRDFVKLKKEFINQYKASDNTANATVDDNSNVANKNIGILNAEIHKPDNIQINRGMVMDKLKELFPDFDHKQYIDDLESHIIYKHDESSFAGAIAPYTYSAKEVVIVKYNGNKLLIPFDELWNIVTEENVCVDSVNDVYQKYPENLYIADRNGDWTAVTHLTKKKRHRDLVRVKTIFGEDIVVTDNHPMIVNKDDINDTVEAINSYGKPQYKIGVKQEFAGINRIDISTAEITSESTESYCFNQNEHSNAWCKRYANVDWKLGYFVGFFIGDGNYDNIDKDIHFTQNNRSTLLTLNSIIYETLGVAGRIYTKKNIHNCYTLDISSDYLYWLLKCYFKIQDKACNKTLPFNIYDFNQDFAKGILCGLIDSDGTINGSQVSIRLASRSAILQCTELLRTLGYSIGNTIQSLPFSNSESYKTNYTLWGVNFSISENSEQLGESYKLKTVNCLKNTPKYKINGETKIVNVQKLSNNDSFVKDNDYIYDITTSTRTFALNNILVHNCCSVSLYPFLINGLKDLGGLSAAPKNIDSFCGMFCNLIFALSGQFAGAVATSEFLVYFDYFARKEWGDDYYKKYNKRISRRFNRKKTIESQIHQYFQQVTYTLNQPAAARGQQSAFVNFSIFDKNFFKGMFDHFKFPDGSSPKWESVQWLQEEFLHWFNNERLKCILTFPVVSVAMVVKNGSEFDNRMYDFVCKELSEGNSFFIYFSDTVDSLSSCCRLRSKIQTKEFNFTNGNMGVKKWPLCA